jgi:hypothetical protein
MWKKALLMEYLESEIRKLIKNEEFDLSQVNTVKLIEEIEKRQECNN